MNVKFTYGHVQGSAVLTYEKFKVYCGMYPKLLFTSCFMANHKKIALAAPSENSYILNYFQQEGLFYVLAKFQVSWMLFTPSRMMTFLYGMACCKCLLNFLDIS